MTTPELYEIYKAHPAVTTDSRKVPVGSVFFALHGGKFDGNRFAAAALEAGAACAVVDDPSVAVSDRYIVVDDTLTALQMLARQHRRTLDVPVLAITGTNGKTTTKELLSRVLSCEFKVAATQGNLNNHIGVPLTLLAIPADTEFAIVEMGAGACGEIADLCRIAEPDYGLITNVGCAHLEGFGSPEGVKRGKGELFDWLAERAGVAFVAEEDRTLVEMAVARAGMRTQYYSRSVADGMRSNLAGDYNKYNIAAAVAVGEYFGVGEAAIREAVESYEPTNHRSQRIDTGRNTVIADCYNANPSSMRAALGFFAAEAAERPRVAILGDMLELGEFSAREHLAVLEYLRDLDVPEVVLVGECFGLAMREFGAAGGRFCAYPDAEAVSRHLSAHPVSGRTVLLKGSNGIGLDRLIPLL